MWAKLGENDTYGPQMMLNVLKSSKSIISFKNKGRSVYRYWSIDPWLSDIHA